MSATSLFKRTIIASSLALVTLAGPSGVDLLPTPAAEAASKKPGTTSTTPPQTATKSNARIEGDSTGSGPATETECEQAADVLNAAYDIIRTSTNANQVLQAAEVASAVEDRSLDRGCFFTNVPS